MKILEMPTKIYRSFNGIEGRTVRTEKGQTFEITTMKRYSGHLVSVVQKSNIQDDGSCYISQMGENFMRIDHGKVRCTENVVKNAHFEALAAFDLKVAELPEAVFVSEVPEVGDILFLGGYGKDKGYSENNWIIYKIDSDKWGKNYHCIEKDTLETCVKDHVSDYKKRKGQTIGMYFEKGFNMSVFGIDENKLAEMLIDAQEVKKMADYLKNVAQEESKRAAEEKAAYLSQFIQADRRKTTAIIKAHCLKTWKISKIEVSTEVYSGGDSMNVKYYAPEKIEELESFISSFQAGHFNGMEDIYEYSNKGAIILEGHILQDYKYVFIDLVECEQPTPSEPNQSEPELIDWDTIFDETVIPATEKPDSDIQIIDYSEKAIAVIGNTRRIKDQLKALGGRFNFRLSCGAGWIFRASQREQILAII